MKNLKYIFKINKTVHVLNAKVSENSKIGIGYVIQTYHFSINQIVNNDFTQDKENCLNCPFSYNMNNGNSGGCYTHKGYQLMGLKSMMRSLSRNFENILDFNILEFKEFINKIKNTYPLDLVRFGAYGEPVLLPLQVVEVLASLSKKSTGYTHQYAKKQYNDYNDFFMASTHTTRERKQAKKLGFRSFFVSNKDIIPENAVNCPASKESANKLSCIKCGLCNGNKTNIKKDVYTLQH